MGAERFFKDSRNMKKSPSGEEGEGGKSQFATFTQKAWMAVATSERRAGTV